MSYRAYTNNFPLALEKVKHTPNTHKSSMTNMLLLCKRLCQWVIDIVKCWYFAYLHISSIYYLSNEVIVPKYVFRMLVKCRFLTLCDGTIVITIEINEIHNARDYIHLSFLHLKQQYTQTRSRITDYILLWTFPIHTTTI